MLTLTPGVRVRLTLILAVVAVGGLAPAATAETFISGFNGGLTSSLGADWVVSPTASPPTFVASLTEGTGAVQLTNDPVAGSWPAMALPGGMALANIMATHRTLVLDAAPTADLSWRQVFVVHNSNAGWNQSGQFDLTPPAEGDLFDRVAFDLTTGTPAWQAQAKAWLAGPAASRTYFELIVVLQGASSSGEPPQTIIDNVRFLAADFVNDEDGDMILEARVGAADLGAWLTAFGTTAAGDADGDSDSDGNDFLIWQREVNLPVTGAGPVPEPSAAALLAIAASASGGSMIRRGRLQSSRVDAGRRNRCR